MRMEVLEDDELLVDYISALAMRNLNYNLYCTARGGVTDREIEEG